MLFQKVLQNRSEEHTSDVAQKKHALIFKNYFDRGAIRMYEYFNDYENWVKATDWQ